jgi:dihydroorotase
MTNPVRKVSYRTDPKTGALESYTCPLFSNFHAHLRTGALLDAIAAETMRGWKHQLVMPNTGIVDTIPKMIAYRDDLIRIRDVHELSTEFIMTLYLTRGLTPQIVEEMAKLDFPCAVKYYPPKPGTTTGSGFGIPLEEAHEVLVAMEQCGVRLLGHFESEEDDDGKPLPHEHREDHFAIHRFPGLRNKYHKLRITFEHATTANAIRCVKEDGSGLTTCTITPQALILVREDLDSLTWRNHGRCMPIAKTKRDRDAVREFAFSGDFRGYAGDDTAAHPSKSKNVPFAEATSGCYWPHSAAAYVDIFYKHGALQNLPKFAAFNGPNAWGLKLPTKNETMHFVRSTNDIPTPSPIPGTDDVVVPFGYTEGNDAYHCGLRLAHCS